MVIEQDLLEACAKGVLIERGFPAEEADEYLKQLRRPHPDKPLVSLVREISSILLTLHAHGKIKDMSN